VALCDAAVRFARRLDYRGAGTVEFFLDVDTGHFHFLEMNARIQVEHPVTEQVTGLDLVALQLAIAAGEDMPLRQQDVQSKGWAIECRINAEDPDNDFMPSPGRITMAQWPTGEGIRIDTHIESGAFVPPYYDSLLGKVIVWGANRPDALSRLRAALAATRIEGVRTNIDYLGRVLADPAFSAGGIDTGFLARFAGQP
jgi:acetyl-CoA carboxylase biotin carboxylase subunit